MGKWRRYQVGQYRLGQLNGRAVAVWRDADGKHRIRLDATTEAEARAALDRYARRRTVLEASESKTIADLFALYMKDRETDGKLMPAFRDNWKALQPHFGAMAPEHDVDIDDLLAHSRFRHLVVARHAAFVALVDAGYSLSATGRIMRRDHTTVMYGIRKVREAGIEARP